MASPQHDIALLNAAIDRIRSTVPHQPYIQTILQDDTPFSSSFQAWEAARVWRGQAPFARDEHLDLQYQTFFYHEHGSDLIQLRVHSPPPQSHGALAPAMPAPASATGTPNQGPKKKISLADYKSQKSKGDRPPAGTSTFVAIGTREHGPQQKLTALPAADKPTDPQSRDFADTASPALKRKRSGDNLQNARTAKLPRPTTNGDTTTTGSPPHKPVRRPSPSPTARRSKTEDKEREERRLFELPGSLSPPGPPLPGRLSPLGNVLPERLSPDLPANIVAELDRRARARAESDSSKTSRESGRKPAVKHDSVLHDVNSKGETVLDLGKPLGSSNDEAVEGTKAEQTAHHNDSVLGESGKDTGHTTEEDSTKTKRHPTFIVRLKIPRRLRQDYRRLLQFRPKPAPHTSHSDHKPLRNESGVSAKTAADPPKQASRSPAPPTHRQQTEAKSYKEPSAHRTAPFQSPPPPFSTLKSSTPSSKRPAAAAMVRKESTDSHATTPNSATPAPKPSPTSVRHGHKPTATSEAWSVEAARLLTLGKTLKTSAAAHLAAKNTELGVLTNIEALCAFMLSFHASEQSAAHLLPPNPHPSARNTWVSIHGFWKYVWGNADRFSALKSIAGLLGQVYLSKVLAWTAEGPASREREAAEAAALLARIAGGPRLGLAELRDRFPETLAKAGEARAAAVKEARPGSYAGALEMPIGLGTPPLEAVRTVVAMLGEWRVGGGKRFERSLKLG